MIDRIKLPLKFPLWSCPGCEKIRFLKWKHQGTAYHRELSNYAHLCKKCHVINDDHWRDMWAEYYNSIR